MGMIGNPADNSLRRVANDSFNGDNSTVAFTLSAAVNNTTDIEVLVDNVQQSPYDGSYSVSGTTLTFSAAPATGTNNIYVIYHVGRTSVVGEAVPQDASVTPAKLDRSYIPGTTVEGAMTTQFGRRNLIINGDMRVNQRGQTVTTSDAFFVDRFKAFYNTDSGRYSIAQDSDSPDNFEYSSKVTITATDDLTGSEHMTFAYYAEGYDVAHLNFGTAAAREFTLSFWVKSSIAGTYGVSFRNHAANRSFVSSYTINSANTWEQKSVTITADANGSWTKTNGIGLIINWELGNSAVYSSSAGTWQSGNYWGLTGGTKLVNTLNATWQITGVQLEVGSVATSFEHRSYGEELALCQRYYQLLAQPGGGGGNWFVGQGSGTTQFIGKAQLACPMRATPDANDPSSWNLIDHDSYSAFTPGDVGAGVPAVQYKVNNTHVELSFTGMNAGTVSDNRPCFIYMYNKLELDAEL